MSIWKKTMDCLGLGPDDAYDDYDDRSNPSRPRGTRGPPPTGAQRSLVGEQHWPTESDETVVKAVPARPSFPSRDFESTGRRPAAVRHRDDSGARSARRPGRRHPRGSSGAPPSTEPATVRPRRFDQAQEVADKFKDGQAGDHQPRGHRP